MKLFEKIKILLEQENWNLSAFHRKIQDLFEDNAIAYLTLHRTVNGQTKVRESTLFQIAVALGKTPEEMRKDTDEEEKFITFRYNKKAYLEIEANKLDFITAKLVLLPKSKTETEQDPIERANFVKWIYGLQGKMTCIVMTEKGVEKHTIGKNESFYFRSTNPHYFENTTGQKAVCILIQNPKYI